MPDPNWYKLIFRIVCDFEPIDIYVKEMDDDALISAIRLADGRTHVRHKEMGAPADVVMNYTVGRVEIFRNITNCESDWPSIRDALSCGMTFTNGHTAIIVHRTDFAPQHYDISF